MKMEIRIFILTVFVGCVFTSSTTKNKIFGQTCFSQKEARAMNSNIFYNRYFISTLDILTELRDDHQETTMDNLKVYELLGDFGNFYQTKDDERYNFLLKSNSTNISLQEYRVTLKPDFVNQAIESTSLFDFIKNKFGLLFNKNENVSERTNIYNFYLISDFKEFVKKRDNFSLTIPYLGNAIKLTEEGCFIVSPIHPGELTLGNNLCMVYQLNQKENGNGIRNDSGYKFTFVKNSNPSDYKGFGTNEINKIETFLESFDLEGDSLKRDENTENLLDLNGFLFVNYDIETFKRDINKMRHKL